MSALADDFRQDYGQASLENMDLLTQAVVDSLREFRGAIDSHVENCRESGMSDSQILCFCHGSVVAAVYGI